jgi:hypothetical protein
MQWSRIDVTRRVCPLGRMHTALIRADALPSRCTRSCGRPPGDRPGRARTGRTLSRWSGKDRSLAFRGAPGFVAPVADEDAGPCLARLGSFEDRACREECCLDPAGCDQCVAGQSVLSVQRERQRHLVPSGLAEGECCPCCVGRIADLARNGERECLGRRCLSTSGHRGECSDAVSLRQESRISWRTRQNARYRNERATAGCLPHQG